MSMTKGPTEPPFQQHQPQPMGLPPVMQQPQQPTGVARVLAFARGLSGKAVVLAAVVFGLQAVMPEGRRPSDLIGSFHGNTESAELTAKRTAQVQTAAEMANAQAAAPANYQMETQLSQTQQQVIAGTMDAQSSMANMADVACIGGGLLGAIFGKDSPDAAQVAQGLQSACGAGDAIRKNMADTLARTARDGSGVVQRSAPVQQAGQVIPVRPYQPNERPVPAALP